MRPSDPYRAYLDVALICLVLGLLLLAQLCCAPAVRFNDGRWVTRGHCVQVTTTMIYWDAIAPDPVSNLPSRVLSVRPFTMTGCR